LVPDNLDPVGHELVGHSAIFLVPKVETRQQLFCRKATFGGSLHPSARTLSMTIILAFLFPVPLMKTVFAPFSSTVMFYSMLWSSG
jgi:hypothetical protein